MESLKKVRFMAKKQGQKFDAIIISVKSFGLFVEIAPFGIEGLVPLRSLPFDNWQVDELEFRLRGRRSKLQFRLGDRIKVQLHSVDRLRRQIDFRYLSHL